MRKKYTNSGILECKIQILKGIKFKYSQTLGVYNYTISIYTKKK